MTDIDKLRKIVAIAAKADAPRLWLVDRLLRHIAEGDTAAFIDTYDRDTPTSGEMLRVISRYAKALRTLRTD